MITFPLDATSVKRLDTCDYRLQDLVQVATKDAPFPFIVVCGHRGQADQDEAVKEHKSKLVWPTSKHNADPSLAVDLAPYIDLQIPWGDPNKFHLLADHIKATALALNLNIIWGGTWSGFRDLPHYELTDKWPK